jgi:hypothetical protein
MSTGQLQLDDPRPPRRRRALWRRPVVAALSTAAHGLVLLALLNAHPPPPVMVEPPPMLVQIVELAPPIPAQTPPQPSPAPSPSPAPPKPDPKPAKAAAPKSPAKPAPVPPRRQTAPAPNADPLPAGEGGKGAAGFELSEGQIAGAARAGAGSGGGSCNMLEWLQGQLRKDRRVQAAMAQAGGGKPVVVWHGGEWIRHGGQEGEGLASVREIVMWEIAFAPDECRRQPVSGLVLISLHDGPGAPRIVMGADRRWAWSDVLHSPYAVTTGRVLRR